MDTNQMAAYLLRSANVHRVKHQVKLAKKSVYRKLFNIKEDNLKTKEFPPDLDLPALYEVDESVAADVADLFEPYYWSATSRDFKREIRIDKNAAHFDQTGQMKIKKFGKNLAEIEERTYDNHCAQIFNRAANASYTGPDGVTLLSQSHPLKVGGTNANTLSAQSPLSHSNVESLIAYMMLTVDTQGNPIPKTPRYLVVPPQLWDTACKICDSKLQTGSMNNDENVVKGRIKLEPLVWPYLKSSTCWFLVCPPEENGLILYKTRKKMEIDKDFDVHLGKYIFVPHVSFDVGWCVYWGVAGSMGTA